MYYIGLDLHSKSSTFWCLSSSGKKVFEKRVKTTVQGFREALARLGGRPAKVVLEASMMTRWAVPQLERLGVEVVEVVAVDPRRLRQIAETKFKTDRADARTLAELLRTGALPKPVWMPSEQTRQLRGQVRVREALVKARSRLMATAWSLLAGVGVVLGKRALVSARGWDRVFKRQDVPQESKALLQVLRGQVEHLTEAIEAAEQLMASQLASPSAQRLQQIPGAGPVVAATTLAVLGEAARFKDVRAAAAYTGMVPSERSSGDRRRMGRITKQGPGALRRVWVQAAQAALRMKDHPLKSWANRLIYRRGRSVAVVALARRMFRWAFALLRDEVDFNPSLVAGKSR